VHCKKCGVKVNKYDAFCSNCGEPLVNAENYHSSDTEQKTAASTKYTARLPARKNKRRYRIFIAALFAAAFAAFAGAVVLSVNPGLSQNTEKSTTQNKINPGENTDNETAVKEIEKSERTEDSPAVLSTAEVSETGTTPALAKADTGSVSQAGQNAEAQMMANTETSKAADAVEARTVSSLTSTYEVIVGNYSWTTALSECINKGGHLATLDSPEEYDKVTAMLDNNENWKGKVFFIGGRRDRAGNLYYWVDKNNQFYGSALNDPSTWIYSYWPADEPSFSDNGVEELVCSIFKYQGSWIINDEPDNMLTTAPEYSGIIGYICEYETASGGANAESETGSTSGTKNTSFTGFSTENAGNSPGNNSYAVVYEGAFADAQLRKEPFENTTSGLTYTLFDMNGDGMKELMFHFRGDRQFGLIWVYSTDGTTWKYMGEIETASLNPDSVYGYDNGFIMCAPLKFRDHFEVAASHYKWNGASFEDILLLSNSYNTLEEIPSIEQLGEAGYYNMSLVTEKAPAFLDVSDTSLLWAASLPPADESMDEGEAYEAYKKNQGISDYRLMDIDGDGISEMLFFIEDQATCGVCTYKDGEVVMLASMELGRTYPGSAPVYYQTNLHQFALTGSSTGYVIYCVYELNNGTATEVQTIEKSRQKPGFTYKQFINGTEVTEDAFYNAVNSIWGWPNVDFMK